MKTSKRPIFELGKKAQSEIISTILIILLVLAAILIVWQVISGTVKKGSAEIEVQSNCLALRMDITKIDTTVNSIKIRPTKDITAYRAYVNGAEFGPIGGNLSALSTATITDPDPLKDINSGDEV